MARIKITKRVKVSGAQGAVPLQEVASPGVVVQSQVGLTIPGKRKPDFGDHPMELDTKPSSLRMKPKSDDDSDDSTIAVDYEVTDEETAYHTCCIHCPLLKKYVKLHGEWPPEPATNKEAKTAPDSHLH